MTTFAEYVAQIAKLQSLAEAARKNEIDGAIKKIKELMDSMALRVKTLLRLEM